MGFVEESTRTIVDLFGSKKTSLASGICLCILVLVNCQVLDLPKKIDWHFKV